MTQVAVYHNIVWSKYKGEVFSSLYQLSGHQGVEFRFAQIAETEGERAALSGVDLRHHRYPFELLFKGSYDALSTGLLSWTLARHVLRSPANLIVLPGFHRVEYWAMLLACMITGKRRAVFCDSTSHDKPRSRLKGLFKRIFFRSCQGYFCYGGRSAEFLLANGARPERIFARCQAAALPIGFDAGRALAERSRARAREAEPRFLFVGRLSPEKNLPSLLQAFRRFRAERGSGRLVLVGAGPQRADLLSQAQALGLHEQVEFAGARDLDGVAMEYARATCLVLPSRSEPWGLVVNEALHYGCPVIVSEACGCRPELVVDGVTGFAHPVGDDRALSRCLARAVDEFGDTARVAAACQAHIEQFSPGRAAEQILVGCAEILENPG